MASNSKLKVEKKREETMMEILFEFQGNRSIINCRKSKILSSIEDSLAELVPQTSASESLAGVEVHTLQSSRHSGKLRGKLGTNHYYLLQRYVKEWEAFVNVDNIDQVKNRDTLTVARVPTLPNVTAPPGGLSLLASTTEQSQTELAHTKVRTIALALVI